MLGRDDNFYHSLPIEILMEIFSLLSPEDCNAAMVDRHSYLTMKRPLFWRAKFIRHFPYLFKNFSREEDIALQQEGASFSWFDQFCKTYHEEYKNLTVTHRKAFSLVKEGDTERLRQSMRSEEETLAMLDAKDARGCTLLEMAQLIGDQAVLNMIYQTLIPYYIDASGYGFNPRFADNLHKRRILYWAIACNQSYETVALLLLQGCRLTEKYFAMKYTAIHIAIRANHIELAKQLLENHPELLEQKDARNQTPLLWAASLGLDDLVDFLIKMHASLDAKTNQPNKEFHHFDSLFWAIKNKHVSTAIKLIDAGVSLTTPLPACGTTPLLYAAKEGCLPVVKRLIDSYSYLINQKDHNGYDAFCLAVRGGHVHVADMLVAAGACKPRRDRRLPFKAIHHAVQSDHLDVLQALIKVNPDFCHQPDEAGLTPLNKAIGLKRINCVVTLLDAGAMLPATIARTGLHPIHFAVKKRSLELVRTLIEKRPELLNHPDARGKTPLMIAAQIGDTELVKYLLSKGANPNAVMDHRNTQNYNPSSLYYVSALYFVFRTKNLEIMQLLIQHGAADFAATDPAQSDLIHLAAGRGRLDLVKLLLDKNPALLNQLDKSDQTPVLWAAANGHVEIVEYLVNLGAKLNAATNKKNHLDSPEQGKTELHYAVEGGHNAIALLLLKKGATLNFELAVNLEKANEEVKAKISLLAYEYKRPREGKYKHYFTLFCRPLFGLGFNQDTKLAAMNALKQCAFFGADVKTLHKHRAALRNGELQQIRRKLGIRNI